MPQSIQPERSQICNELLSQKQRITLNTTIINYKIIKGNFHGQYDEIKGQLR